MREDGDGPLMIGCGVEDGKRCDVDNIFTADEYVQCFWTESRAFAYRARFFAEKVLGTETITFRTRSIR